MAEIIVHDTHLQFHCSTSQTMARGAFYERLIKSVKHSLYKVLQKKVPTEVELETLIVEIEGSLNNRPLTYIEEEPSDPVILRPIDFIQLNSMQCKKPLNVLIPLEVRETGQQQAPDTEGNTTNPPNENSKEAEQNLAETTTTFRPRTHANTTALALKIAHDSPPRENQKCEKAPKKNPLIENLVFTFIPIACIFFTSK
uniref:Cytokin_check_N domain-containing protein n=1 Tax=Angiostrongylus cantonensis TaxID=6313 RepID=A0A0K0CUP1_ANGCA